LKETLISSQPWKHDTLWTVEKKNGIFKPVNGAKLGIVLTFPIFTMTISFQKLVRGTGRRGVDLEAKRTGQLALRGRPRP